MRERSEELNSFELITKLTSCHLTTWRIYKTYPNIIASKNQSILDFLISKSERPERWPVWSSFSFPPTSHHPLWQHNKEEGNNLIAN